jgi:hypothetical protein
MIPGPIENTGVKVSHGQSAGWLGKEYDPVHLSFDPAVEGYRSARVFDRARRFLDRLDLTGSSIDESTKSLFEAPTRNAFELKSERQDVRDAYGRSSFGQSCLLARRLVEAGVRLVTVNMFDTVFNRTTWDCHGSAPFSTLDDYARDLLPVLDQSLSALLDDLEHRGLLDTTLVVATGEFGRTPRLNAAGGRDHWPGVWSAVLAGGGVRGGQVIGSSDAHAAAPADRPVTPQEILATMYRSLGMSSQQSLTGGSGEPIPLLDGAEAIEELFT